MLDKSHPKKPSFQTSILSTPFLSTSEATCPAEVYKIVELTHYKLLQTVGTICDKNKLGYKICVEECLVKDNTALGTVPAAGAIPHYHRSLADHSSLACSRVGSRHD
jgi:hypothetical protein